MAKRTRKNLARNIPLSIDEKLLTDVDRVAGDRNETRSLVMRKAIQEGLPLVKAGGNADVLTLDSEISADVDQAAKETKLKRNKILLEAIRIGLQPFVSRTMSEKMSLANGQSPEERDQMLQALEVSWKIYDDPMVREHRRLVIERGNAVSRLMDILQHIPEAKRRDDLLMRLTEHRRLPGGGGGGAAWGNGLSNEEIEWQVLMAEKYGVNSATWPKEECEAREAARKLESESKK
jgi:predicted transcriptional regulator